MTTYNLHNNLNSTITSHQDKQENFLLESPYFVSRTALMLSMQYGGKDISSILGYSS